MPEATILELPRGPTIAGTRITVYAVMEHLDGGATEQDLLEIFPSLSAQEVRVACAYVAANEARLRPEYKKIMARHRRGNPPELQAKLEQSHLRFKAWVKEKVGRDWPSMNGQAHD